MSVYLINTLKIKSTNNIQVNNNKIFGLQQQSSIIGYQPALNFLPINQISNNTIKPKSSIGLTDSVHASLRNYCTITNTYINSGYYVPYLKSRLQIKPPSIDEIYYI